MKGIWIVLILILILTLMGVLLYYSGGIEPGEGNKEDEEGAESVDNPENIESNIETLVEGIPLINWKNRITKKPFGMLIRPETSPVQPEKFSGYHTGTDFEVFENELESEVLVRAICDGEVVESRYVSGYGGVTVQECSYKEVTVFVLYGHINISNVKSSVGTLKKDEVIAVLSDDKSYFSGGERKHLHLGIIDQKNVNFKGYVGSKSELTGWIDYEEFIK